MLDKLQLKVLVLTWAMGLVSLAIETPVLNLKVKSPVAADTLIGSIKSSQMEAPYYIVPIKPEDPDMFNKDLRIDLETGDIYANSELRTRHKKSFKFSALSINQGLAISVTVTLLNDAKPKVVTPQPMTEEPRSTTPTVTVAHVPAIKQSFRIESTSLSADSTPVPYQAITQNQITVSLPKTTPPPTTATTAPSPLKKPTKQSDQASYELTENIKILLFLLVGCLAILLLTLYTTFFLIRRNQAQSGRIMVNSRARSSQQSDQLNFTCTSSTNLTIKQEMAMNNRSYLSKFITWLKPVDTGLCSSQKTSTSASLANDSLRSKKSASQLHHDNLVIRPRVQTLFTYSDGYLNDMGINMLDSLRNGKQLVGGMSHNGAGFNLACDSNRSSNLIEACGDTPVVLSVGKSASSNIQNEYLDVELWANMLDWRPEYNSIAHVLDELAQLESNRKQ